MAKPPPTTANPPLIRVLCANHADIIGRWGEAGKRLESLGVRSEIIKALPPGFNAGLAQRAASDTINDPRGVLVISPARDPRRRPLFDELDQPTLLEFLILLNTSGRLACVKAEDFDTSQLPSALSSVPAFVLSDPRSMESLAGWARSATSSGAGASAPVLASDAPRAILHVLADDTGRKRGEFIRDELARRGVRCDVAPTMGKDGSFMAAVDNARDLGSGRLQAVLFSAGPDEMYGITDEIFDDRLTVDDRARRLSRYFPAQREMKHRIEIWNSAAISRRFMFIAHTSRDDARALPQRLREKQAYFAGSPEDLDRLAREIASFRGNTTPDWDWKPSTIAGPAPIAQASSAAAPDSLPISALSSFSLSPAAQAILDRAKAMTPPGGRWSTLSTLAFLFATKELGRETPQNEDTIHFVHRYIDREAASGYQTLYETTVRTWIEDSPPDVGTDQRPGEWVETITPNVQRLFEQARNIAITLPIKSAADPGLQVELAYVAGRIHARHLFAALLTFDPGPGTPNNVVSKLTGLGINIAAMKSALFEVITANTPEDNATAWREVLGLPPPVFQSAAPPPMAGVKVPIVAEQAESPAPPPSDAPPAIEVPERFQFSTAARAVLDLARALVATVAPTGNVGRPTTVNSVALLFALAETGEKPGADADAAAFRRYLRPGSAEPYYRARHHYFPQHHRALGGDDQPDVSGVRSLSADALALLDEARRIALLTNPNLLGLAGGDATIHPVHLAAALTTTAIADPAPPHRELLDGIGVPPADLARSLAAGAMRGGPFTVVPGWKTALRPVLGDSIQELLPDAYRVKFDNDDNKTDKLNLRHEIDALAYLIAARAVQPPLAIGLFGEWGSGKSFFMSRLRERVNEIADAARAADAAARAQVERGEQPAIETDKIEWHRHICQIEFNAWHYVEGNIWASLVEHIFSNLRSSLVSPKASAEAQRKQEEEFRREFETSKHALAELESRISSAQKDLENAQAAVANARDNHRLKAGLLGELKSGQTALVVIRALLEKTDFVAALRELGLTDEVLNSPARVREEIQKLAAEGEAWKSPLSLLSGRAIGGRFMWIILALLLLITPLIVLAVTSLLSAFDREIKLIVGLSVQFAAVCTAVLGWIGTQAGRLAKARAKLEPVMRQLEERRSEELVRTERDLSVAKSNLDQAVSDFAQQQKKIEELRAQEKAATATELMAQFIEQRAACTDYRRHLGITAIVRRDFAKLTELVAHRSAESRAEPVDEFARQPIDRIVLYIDDLDRCPPDKVVAVLEAIHLILAFKLFVVVVGVDARWISHSLKKKYGSLLSGRAAGPGRLREPGARILGESSHTPAAVPEDYLEKIFQVPFRLRSLTSTGTRSLLEHLTKPPGPAAATARATTPATSSVAGPVPQSDAAARTPAARIVEPKHTAAAVPVPIPTTGRADTSAATATAARPSAAAPGPATPGPATAASPTGAAPVENSAAPPATVPPAARPATTSPDSPAVELAPGLLQLTKDEVNFMMELAPVIGRSPRAVHRFVNCYRLLKAARDPRAVAAFETAASDGSVPAYEAAMLMLGLVIGIPEIAAPALSMLVGRVPTAELSNLITDWDKDPRISSEPDWKQRIEPFLRKYAKARGKPCPISPFRDAASAVARYSFRTGMMEELEPAAQSTP